MIFTRGIRKRAKIDLPIQKWWCLDERHHSYGVIILLTHYFPIMFPHLTMMPSMAVGKHTVRSAVSVVEIEDEDGQ